MTLKKCDRCGMTVDEDKSMDNWQALWRVRYGDDDGNEKPIGDFCESCWIEIEAFAKTAPDRAIQVPKALE